ncbi:MAG: hypothetical protein AB7Y46_02035 [Armatimonadota bacterium]
MIGEQRAKALFAGGIALFVTGLVVLMLFVVPAARHNQVALAQGEMPGPEAFPPEAPGAPGAPGMPAGPEAMPPEAGMPAGPEAMPGMPGTAGGAAAPAPAPTGEVITGAPPLEPSRPNPFAPRAAGAVAEAARAVAGFTYGPDWSQLPISERVAFVRTEIPPAPTPPLPPLAEPPETVIRITSILWDASGQAQAAYEDEQGETGVLKPGDRTHGYVVIEIGRSGVVLEEQATGNRVELELRPRTERPQPQRPGVTTGGRQQPGAATGRRRPTTTGGAEGTQRPGTGGARPTRPQYPAAPPG